MLTGNYLGNSNLDVKLTPQMALNFSQLSVTANTEKSKSLITD